MNFYYCSFSAYAACFASSCTTELSIFSLWKLKNQQCSTSTRDLIKVAPPIERLEREKKRKKPSSQRESNSGPTDPKSDVQLELPPQPLRKVDSRRNEKFGQMFRAPETRCKKSSSVLTRNRRRLNFCQVWIKSFESCSVSGSRKSCGPSCRNIES